MVNENNIPSKEDHDKEESFELGKRSITSTKGRSRFELLADNKSKSFLFKPFFYLGFSIFIFLFLILIFFYSVTYIIPPMKDAIKVGEVTYTRGDVVKFIRFNQRITEDLGMEFEIGNSLFEALRVILEGELAYQVAPKYEHMRCNTWQLPIHTCTCICFIYHNLFSTRRSLHGVYVC